jgi:hypothetical protein
MSNQIEFTMVKTEFPNGWKETPFELLLKRLDENGFSIKETKEVSADEMVMDARPHADIYVIEKDGRQFTFQIGLTRDLRHGDEHLDGIGWFKPRYSGKAAPVKFEIPPDMDVDGKCAAVEYWIRDITNYFYGRPAEKRNFNYKHWEHLRFEERARIKRETEARYQDYLKHPDKYFGPPPRLVEPELYPNTTVAVVPTTEPQGLYFALKHLYKDEPLKATSFRKGKKNP